MNSGNIFVHIVNYAVQIVKTINPEADNDTIFPNMNQYADGIYYVRIINTEGIFVERFVSQK